MTVDESKELLDLARKVAAGDAQTSELLQRAVSRAHSLQAQVDKANATIERLTRHTGSLFDENALLRLELGGDVTARVRAAAYRVVRAEQGDAGAVSEHDAAGMVGG